MQEIKEKLQYLQGLSAGFDFQDNSHEARIIREIVEVLGETINKLDQLWEAQRELEAFSELLDEEILEENLDWIEVRCAQCGEKVYFESDIAVDDDVIEVTCPTCDQVVYINDGSFDFEPAIFDAQKLGRHPAGCRCHSL